MSPPPDQLVDTSVAVPLVVVDHEHHEQVWEELGSSNLGLAGHAQFETYSVLTRLPPPTRRTPAECQRLLERNFPASRYLSASQHAAALAQFAQLGIAGVAIYDALIGLVALEQGITLVTRDRRALDTYRLLGVPVRVIG